MNFSMKKLGGVTMIKRDVLVAMFLAVVLALAGCGKGKVRYGEAIPDNVKVVKLKEIVDNPEQYKGREVVLEGNFNGACCPTDFNYKEGLEGCEVYPQGFSNPKLDKGKPIKVYGIVRSIQKKTGDDDEGKEEKQHEIYIEAKGVEVK